jgi:hypothetical protein
MATVITELEDRSRTMVSSLSLQFGLQCDLLPSLSSCMGQLSSIIGQKATMRRIKARAWTDLA